MTMYARVTVNSSLKRFSAVVTVSLLCLCAFKLCYCVASHMALLGDKFLV